MQSVVHLSKKAAIKLFGAPITTMSSVEASNAVFCFAGEFGYEIVSWLPYLNFLKKHTGITLNTLGRPGSRPFYYFSDNHTELAAGEIGHVWGDPESYHRIKQAVAPKRLVFPEMLADGELKRLEIDGHRWMNQDIHAPIDQTVYEPLDLGVINPQPEFAVREPYVVLNNKFIRQWHYRDPVNCFQRADLIAVRDAIRALGYSIVYNHFIEATGADSYLPLDDTDIFGRLDGTVDMRDTYNKSMSPERRNRLQISLYRRAHSVIGPQGGNLYLPAICRRPLLILMRAGDYIDYTELGRLYSVPVDVFYEPRHLLQWIKTTMKPVPVPGTPAIKR